MFGGGGRSSLNEHEGRVEIWSLPAARRATCVWLLVVGGPAAAWNPYTFHVGPVLVLEYNSNWLVLARGRKNPGSGQDQDWLYREASVGPCQLGVHSLPKHTYTHTHTQRVYRSFPSFIYITWKNYTLGWRPILYMLHGGLEVKITITLVAVKTMTNKIEVIILLS